MADRHRHVVTPRREPVGVPPIQCSSRKLVYRDKIRILGDMAARDQIFCLLEIGGWIPWLSCGLVAGLKLKIM